MLNHNFQSQPSSHFYELLRLSRKNTTVFLRKMTDNNFNLPVIERLIIDLDAVKPPHGCSVLYNFSFGKIVWNKSVEGKNKFLTPKIETRLGMNVSEELSIFLCRNEVPYGLDVYNFLISFPDQIPTEWEGLTITFRGAILKYGDGLGYPSIICTKGKCVESHSLLKISTCVGAGRGLL